MRLYVVHAEIRTTPSTSNFVYLDRVFGEFTSRKRAEQAAVRLSGREDVRSIAIKEYNEA